MQDYNSRRRMMVDTQVRPSDVTKLPVIDAMLRIPREKFVPAPLREAAYVGENLEFAPGRVLLEPRSLAKMLDALNVGPEDLVLDVGCGTGYSTAVTAWMAEAVVGLEEIEAAAEEAESHLAALNVDNALVVQARLCEGAPQHGPYDAILVQGGVEQFPDSLTGQLKEGGRVACIFMEGALGVCRIGLRMGGQITWRDFFNASAPVLGGFEKAQEFSL